jgi:hypothetical protein
MKSGKLYILHTIVVFDCIYCNLTMKYWKDNIRMNLREIEWKGVNKMHVAQDSSGGACEHDNEPLGSIKGRGDLH